MSKVDGRKNNGGHKTAGRKTKEEHERIRNLLSPFIPNAIETVANIMQNGKRESDRLKAAELMLAYRFGKPQVQVDVKASDETGKSIAPVQFIQTIDVKSEEIK